MVYPPTPLSKGGKGGSELAERLKVELEQPGKERIRDLVKNPMRLALLCYSWQIRQGSLPETKTGLYEQFVSALYEWKQEFFPTTSQQRKELNAALGKLALKGMEQFESRFRLRHRLVTEVLGEADEPLLQLALQLGWLNIVGVAVENPDERVYAFYHPTFQEYFAACAIEDWDFFLPRNHGDRPVEGKQYRIFEQQWQQVYLLWIGRGDIENNEKEKFIDMLVQFNDGCSEWSFENWKGFYEYQACFKTGIGISEFKNCSVCEQIIAEIIKYCFGYFRIQQKRWIICLDIAQRARDVLPQSDRQRVIKELISILESIDENTRSWVAEKFVLLASIDKKNTRSWVAESLGKIAVGNESAIAALIGILTSADNFDRHCDTHLRVAESLGKIAVGNESAITALIGILASTYHQDTRSTVADILGKIAVGNESAIAALIGILESTDHEDTRWMVAESLGKIDVGNKMAIKALISILQSTEYESTRRRVAESLGKIDVGNEIAIAALIGILESTDCEDFRSWVAESLSQIDVGNETAIAALIGILESTDCEDFRSWVAESLSQIDVGNETAIKALIGILASTDNLNARRMVAEILGKIAVGNETAIKALISILASTDDEYTRWMVAESLGKIDVGNKSAIKALIGILESTDNKDFRGWVAESLGKIDVGNESAIKALIGILESTDNEFLRSWVAESLGKIDVGNESAIKALIGILESTDNEDTREMVAKSLGEILEIKNNYLMTVSALNKHLTNEVDENNFNLYDYCFAILWKCSENLTYPEFYQAWHNLLPKTPHPETEDNTPVGNTPIAQSLETQIIDIFTQLEPTEQTYLLPINARTLLNETETSAIAQELCNLIYLTAFPDEDIPEGIDNAAKLKPKIQQIKKRLQKRHLALIITECDPYPELVNFLHKLTNILHIAWISDRQLEPPLRGFPPNQPNLLSAIQTWLFEIG